MNSHCLIPSHILESNIVFRPWRNSNSIIDLINSLLTITRTLGLDKALTDETYISLFTQAQGYLALSPKLEGTLELRKSNSPTNINTQFRVEGRVKVVRLCHNPNPSKSFRLRVTPYLDPQLTVTLSHISILINTWFTSVSKLCLVKGGLKYPLNIAFRTDLSYTVSEFTLGLPMDVRKRNQSLVSTGYPSAKLFDDSKPRVVLIKGEPKVLPTAFTQEETHYSALPTLLKPGTILKAQFKVDWVLEDGTLKVLVKVCNGSVIVTPSQEEDLDLLKLMEHFEDKL